MEKLLQWSTAQQSSDPEVRAQAPAPDPKLLAQVLGADTGKDDAQLMKEDITVLVCDDPNISIDDKLIALEDFEMLVQNLDNANNISPMGIWPEIAKLYTYEGEERDEFRGMGALITGTAVQNNLKCQKDFLKHVGKEGFTSLMKLADKGNNYNVRARALYALSGLIGHNGDLYELFVESNGWDFLTGILAECFKNEKKDNKVLLRVLSLLKSILYDEVVEEGQEVRSSKKDRLCCVTDRNIVHLLADKLSETTSSVEVNERIINILSYLHENSFEFSSEDIKEIQQKVASLSDHKVYNTEEIKTLKSLV
ncbi:unnamed protein product [Pichia kudriavzevii]|uniref:Hsp70 nucleotide exchange factor FES1 n=1 Tax=Pichia kudriavzevii TaxID=4909 RepID=A0A099P7Y7_PICKU|nr:hypothetical protein JL09_g573 [Pichia kudriavzevii]